PYVFFGERATGIPRFANRLRLCSMPNFASGSGSVHTSHTKIPRRAGVSTRHEPTTVWFTHYSEEVTRCNGSPRSWVIAAPVIAAPVRAPRPPEAKLQAWLADEDVASATPRRCGPRCGLRGSLHPRNVADRRSRRGRAREGAAQIDRRDLRRAPDAQCTS